MSEALNTIIREAYDLFSGYTLGDTLDVCTASCCMASDTEEVLLTCSIHRLGQKELQQFLTAASNESATYINQVKYFLPRMLEFLAVEQDMNYGFETALNKLYIGNKTAWNNPLEVDLVKRFIEALFLQSLYRQHTRIPLDDLLVMSHESGLKHIKALLELWINHADAPNSVRNLVHLLRDVENGRYAYWSEPNDMDNDISAWVVSNSTKTVFYEKVKAELNGLVQKEMYIQVGNAGFVSEAEYKDALSFLEM